MPCAVVRYGPSIGSVFSSAIVPSRLNFCRTLIIGESGAGDEITVERKNGHPFTVRLYARLIFSAQYAPRSDDSSSGFFDRWVVVPFNNRIRGTQREIAQDKLLASLTTPQQLSGLLNRALDRSERLRRTNRFTTTESTRQAGEEFRKVTDPFPVWIAKNIVVGSDVYVVKSTLRESYANECHRVGRPVLNDTAFSIALKRIFSELKEDYRTVATKREHCWLGIGLKR